MTLELPKYISFLPKIECNLRCPMCYYYGERGTYLNPQTRQNQREVEFDRWRPVFDTLLPNCRQIEIFGGEPLFYKHIAELLDYLSGTKTQSLLITNGWTLEEMTPIILAAPPSQLAVSLDGTKEIHNRLRGKNSFERAWSGLEHLARCRKAASSQAPKLKIYTTIVPENAANLFEFAQFLQQSDVDFDSWVVFLASRFSEAQQKHYQDFLSTNFPEVRQLETLGNMHWGNDSAFELLGPQVVEAYDRIRRLFAATPPRFEYRLAPSESSRTLQFYGQKTLPGGCAAPWNHLALLPSGDAAFTTFFHHLTLGNVFEQPLQEIWEGPQAMRYREIFQNTRASFCSQCSQKFLSPEQGMF